MKIYEVEFKSTTYRTYHVLAPNKKFAEGKALEELEDDDCLSFTPDKDAWIDNAEVRFITEHDVNKVLEDATRLEESEE